MNIAPAQYMNANSIAKESTLILLKNILKNTENCCAALPETMLFIDCIVWVCLSKSRFIVAGGKKIYQTTEDKVTPTNRNIRKTIALLCSLSSLLSPSITKSFLSSNIIVLYTTGMHAITVKKTIIKLA